MPTSFSTNPNNVSALVGVGGFTAGATSLTLRVGDGAKFPALSAGQWLRVSLVRAAVAYSPLATGADWTVLKATAVTGDVLTVDATALEGTAHSYVEGDVVECRVTGGHLDAIETAINANEVAVAALQADDATTVHTTTSYANPTWITSLAASKITGSLPESQVTGLVSDLALKAPLASPIFTGSPSSLGAGALSRNQAWGAGALAVNTTGDQNTAIGSAALAANTTGATNTALGRNALAANTTGGANMAIGRAALQAAVDCINNVAIGDQALGTAVTGVNHCTAVGAQAGISKTAGSLCTSIGAFATTANFAQSTALGYNAACTASNQMMLGTSAETVVFPGQLQLPTTADANIPNGGIAWSTTTPNALKVRTPAGTLKTVTLA